MELSQRIYSIKPKDVGALPILSNCKVQVMPAVPPQPSPIAYLADVELTPYSRLGRQV